MPDQANSTFASASWGNTSRMPALSIAELRRGLPGVSEKVMTQHLREMEQDGLVHRHVYAEVPPRVEYSLTGDGRDLNRALGPLGDWGRERIRRHGMGLVDHADAARMPRP